jgi:integrase
LLNDIINTGFKIFEYALENELIDNTRNPFSNKKKKIPRNAPKYERSPIDDTQKRLILSVPHRMQSSALIMLYCGLRKGELIALEWSDINFTEKIISVTKSAVRIGTNTYEVTPHTKNGSIQTITSWNKTWESYQKHLNYQLYKDEMKKLHKEPKDYYAPTGIPDIMDKFSAHQLRHTYCTMLYMAGVDILTASKLMGYSSVNITLKIYTHL